MGSQLLWKPAEPEPEILEDFDTTALDLSSSVRYMKTDPPDSAGLLEAFRARSNGTRTVSRNNLQDYLQKMDQFEKDHREDVYVDHEKFGLLVSTFKRIDRIQTLVGHGNFNVLSFDEMVRFSKKYPGIGRFTKAEMDFLEELFFTSARHYGFLGEKVQTELTVAVPKKDRYKVPYTGHFLYKGDSLKLYAKVTEDLGRNILLSSGIRSIVKQTHLFLARTIQTRGNLSRASRSLAPPGHSFHGVGDFDVGKKGFGRRNFTTAFAHTKEFKRLVELGYVAMRYPQGNLLGVRFEPWHIKVV
jgi:D-alanyl-D-alanine carboxypeptidase